MEKVMKSHIVYNDNSMDNNSARKHAKTEKRKKHFSTADYFLKILILGDTGVGKSSILSSYTDREFPKHIVGTAGIDHRVKDIMMKGK
jgi:GTPase SAR1 family protein